MILCLLGELGCPWTDLISIGSWEASYCGTDHSLCWTLVSSAGQNVAPIPRWIRGRGAGARSVRSPDLKDGIAVGIGVTMACPRWMVVIWAHVDQGGLGAVLSWWELGGTLALDRASALQQGERTIYVHSVFWVPGVAHWGLGMLCYSVWLSAWPLPYCLQERVFSKKYWCFGS